MHEGTCGECGRPDRLLLVTLYDTIGRGYQCFRAEDPSLVAAIRVGLGTGERVLNVGAGPGSYEPLDCRVVALEPSWVMLQQRAERSSRRVLRAVAAPLPFRDDAFDAAMAILTVHHWPDRERGLQELARVSRRRVIVTWDPQAEPFWLVDYFPRIFDIDRRIFPPLDDLRRCLGPATVTALPIPRDCRDGFLGAYWGRPEAYLDSGLRSAISTFSRLESIEEGLHHLRQDLESGEWERRYPDLSGRSELDVGYRLVVA
ncbi:MAG: class I SAM-dependent methyltransferase [Thermoanaerobaculia bacterium]|nr:class I SAM-dependent methyltransferase [Thermoanaerobaculia bacterium]